MAETKILFLDIETAPSLGYVWEMYDTNVLAIKKHWYILSFAYKWMGEQRVQCRALPDYRRFKRDIEDDKSLCLDLRALLDDADVVIAHNGDRFDLRKSNARFVFHGMKPPSPYKTVDTLKLSRRYFKFDSNRLTHLAQYLGIGRKLPHTGLDLWLACMKGKRGAWKMMREYNTHDVTLLEGLYLKLRPWAMNHPNLSHITRVAIACPSCQSTDTINKGFNYYSTGKKHYRLCKNCGRYFVFGRHLPLNKV